MFHASNLNPSTMPKKGKRPCVQFIIQFYLTRAIFIHRFRFRDYLEMVKLFVRDWMYDYASQKASKNDFLENQGKKKMKPSTNEKIQCLYALDQLMSLKCCKITICVCVCVCVCTMESQ